MKVFERLSMCVTNFTRIEGKSGTTKFIQIFLLILGSIFAMLLGGFLIAAILIASPLITVLILLFLIGYGLVAGLSSKK